MSDTPSNVTLRSSIPAARDFVRFEPHASAHHPALRLALSALIPCVFLSIMGRLDLLPVALMTSVAAVYGRRAPARRRLAMQAEIGALQVCLVTAGAAASAASFPVTTILGLTSLVAGIATVVADRRGWMPPGALFPTFAFAVVANIPATPDELLSIAAVAVGSALAALLVTALWSLPALLRGGTQVGFPAMPPPMPVTLAHAAICLLGGAIAGFVALSLGLTHPYWAIVSAIVPVFGTATHTQLVRSGHRLLGTLLGVGSSALIFLLPFDGISMMALLLVLMVCTELFVARNYALALFFVTPMTIGFALMGGDSSVPDLLSARIIETVLGLGVAVVLLLCSHAVRHPRRCATDE